MNHKIIELLYENVEELEGVDITPEMGLISGGFMDSFSVIGLISSLEETFHISIDLDQVELSEFDTVNSIVQIVQGILK